MPIIHVLKPFILQHDAQQIGVTKNDRGEEVPAYADHGERQFFAAGYHEVSDKVANHFYVRAHCEGFVEPPPKPEQADYAQRMLLAARAGRNTTSVAEAAPPPAPLPPGVTVSTPVQHRFAGHHVEDVPPPPTPSWMGRTS
jgi:hypothetical protein